MNRQFQLCGQQRRCGLVESGRTKTSDKREPACPVSGHAAEELSAAAPSKPGASGGCGRPIEVLRSTVQCRRLRSGLLPAGHWRVEHGVGIGRHDPPVPATCGQTHGARSRKHGGSQADKARPGARQLDRGRRARLESTARPPLARANSDVAALGRGVRSTRTERRQRSQSRRRMPLHAPGPAPSARPRTRRSPRSGTAGGTGG